MLQTFFFSNVIKQSEICTSLENKSLSAQSVGTFKCTECLSNECSGFDTKLHLIIGQELWKMQSTLSLPLFPGPLCPRVVALDRVPSMGHTEHCKQWLCSTELLEIELFDYLNVCKNKYLNELFVIYSNTCNHLTVYNWMSNVR